MQSAVPILSLLVIFVVINGINTYDCDGVTCGTNEKCEIYNNYPICKCKDGYKIESYSQQCVEFKDDCDGITCGTNEKCTIRNNHPICWCKHGYKRNSNMECVKDKTDDCRYVTCGTNKKCKMYNNHPICQCKDGYEIESSSEACVKSGNDCDGITCGTNEKCTIRNDQPICRCKDGYVKNPRTGECVSEGMFASLKQNGSCFPLSSHERDPHDEGRESQVANCDTDAIMQVPCPAVTPSAPESVKLTYVHYARGTVITAEQFDEFRGRRARNVLCGTRKMRSTFA